MLCIWFVATLVYGVCYIECCIVCCVVAFLIPNGGGFVGGWSGFVGMVGGGFVGMVGGGFVGGLE